MPAKLDTKAIFEKYDTGDTLYTIDHMPEQLIRAWDAASAVRMPARYKKAQHIVLMGMGGSHLAPHMLKYATHQGGRSLPFEIVNDYHVPCYVGRNSLVILSSYSGTTEEILHAAKEAKAKGAMIIGITTGGPLLKFLQKNKYPHYHIDAGEIEAQPRYTLGFSFAGIAAMLKELGAIKIYKKDIQAMMDAMFDVVETSEFEVLQANNPAKLIAKELKGKQVFVVAAEHLTPNAHIMQNQITETAKQFAQHLVLPEINHYLFEGLDYPKGFMKNVAVVILRSNHYHKRTQKRFDLTAEVFEEKGAQVIDYAANGETRFEEQAEMLQYGSYMILYLAMLNEVDPQFIPCVKDFKAKLGK
jgi:glucose/mannose-6-phosphate isomerase